MVTHEATDVAKALISVFSHFGFPSEILSDCGTEFMSQIMKVFLSEFEIKQIRSIPYHPATNGSCERFNGTLKSMIKAVADEFPDTWDQTPYHGYFSLTERYLLRLWVSHPLSYCLLDLSQVLCH